MTTYNKKTGGSINWAQILAVAVAANLLGGLVFVVTEGLVPSWVVYPILLIIGTVLLRRRAKTGAVFLLGSAALFVLVHFPFTPFGPAGSACPDCSQPLLWVTLFIIPVLTVFVAVMAWRQIRHNDSKQA